MNLLELLGIIFLAVIIVNIAVGVWAIRKALFRENNDMEVSTNRRA
jgi:hypothetical protein